MTVEAARGCGYRKVGGLYLCGGGASMQCDRIPYEIVNCPTCGSGLKFSRGFTWLDWYKYAGLHKDEGNCACSIACPICHPEMRRPLVATAPELNEWKSFGLLWIGERFYSPDNFIKEAIQMGVSRRIAAIPKNLKLGETWILCAHKHVIPFKNENNEDDFKPAVFYAFRPTSLELLIWKSEATEEKLAELIKKNITPIIIPDGDKEHDPSTPLGLDDEEKVEVENRMVFNDLRSKLRR